MSFSPGDIIAIIGALAAAIVSVITAVKQSNTQTKMDTNHAEVSEKLEAIKEQTK